MNCSKPNCTGTLRVTHTYSLGSVKYQRAICERCKLPHCLTTTAEPAEKRGTGAKARAGTAVP